MSWLSCSCSFCDFATSFSASVAKFFFAFASFAVSYMIQNGVLMAYGARPKSANLWSSLNSQIMLGGLRVPLLQVAQGDARDRVAGDDHEEAPLLEQSLGTFSGLFGSLLETALNDLR